jgi:hypothetical protein
MPPVGFEPTIRASERPQTHTLDRAANEIGTCARLGTAVAQRLKYCATNQEVAGSIPDGVMEFFIDTNPSDRTMALGSTKPPTEMSTGSISWG